ncbi:Drug RA1 family ABC transporter ATPase [Oleiphilus messinensis]|uniref:ATP-binding protein Uup n=1 Tax=Oleiphilus messinensis TaxID=141451 RepID=A0A1Y0I9X4_9GAMM|nr:ATP-binding cassette domain-containing protein [Oleiphilus messinensis]ARU56566.1 Drug RA1 family ABC transporter ATPase [Oleiphilus messinensis]
MSLLRFDQVCLAYGLKPLLHDVDFSMQNKERVCLVGRNGEGKSSFLKVLAGETIPDSGTRWVTQGLKIAVLQQDMPQLDEQSVFDVVASGLDNVGELLAEYHHLIQQDLSDDAMSRLEVVQSKLEAMDGWNLNNAVENIIDRLQLPSETLMGSLSGGWKRRVLLARALVIQPDLLVLDEPTNHLDIPTIRWLEAQLLQFQGSILFVSHDRSFIRAMATRIIELDRGNLTSWPGNYEAYLEGKRKLLEDEQKQNALFDKKLSEEETWIRKGIKARRTRNEGRVRALKALREERQQRIDVVGNVSMKMEAANLSGKIVVELSDVSMAFTEGKPVIKNFSTVIMRGDRVGLLGENGCGKTTLVNLLLGKLQPGSGHVKQGTNQEVAYFDQLRDALDFERSVADNIAEGREFIEINGSNQHVMGYLNNFLFTAERARTPVKALSGGEKNRLLLAKLFSKPANIMVLDEPTNDLDVETLELLEEALVDFQGTLLLISHDREFLDNIVTSTLAFEGGGHIQEYVGGYEDWRRQGGAFPSERKSASDSAVSTEVKSKAKPVSASDSEPASKAAAVTGAKRKKLSYKDKLELEKLPARIESLETEIDRVQSEINDPGFYQKDHEFVSSTLDSLAAFEAELEQAMERWVELEAEE